MNIELIKQKSGIIGEIGCSWPWTDNEKISMEASVMAHKETGLPLLIHPGRNQFARVGKILSRV